MRLVFAVLAGALAAAGAAAGAPPSATSFVGDAEARIRAALSEPGKPEGARAEQAGSEVARVFDCAGFSRETLKDYWTTLGDERRSELAGLVCKAVRHDLLRALASADAGPAEYAREVVKDGRTHVDAVITGVRKGRRLKTYVTYILERDPAGWQVVDARTDGAALTWTYRVRLRRVVRRDGLDGLAPWLRKRVARGQPGKAIPE